MKAIVLAAGLGTRLRPITLTMPKPLVPVGGKPLLDWALDALVAADIDSVIVNTSYLHEQVEQHLRSRGQPRVTVSCELPKPLETGGGIYKALPQLGDAPFLVLNSDTICLDGPSGSALTRLMALWDDSVDFLMLMQPLSRAIGFYTHGDFVLSEDGRIRRPVEGEPAPYVFTGIEIIHPRVFVDCPQGPFSLNRLWERSRGPDGWYGRLRAVVHDGDWLHVGEPRGLDEVEAYLGRYSVGTSTGSRI